MKKELPRFYGPIGSTFKASDYGLLQFFPWFGLQNYVY